MNYTYSLIIPHYNIPNLLKRLLDTIPLRRDLQVIVVDDCSSKNIDQLNKLKTDYSWVEWYSSNSNGGGGRARNIGLNKAKGKYILFADADDYFEQDFNLILNEYAHKEFDIAFFKGNSVDSSTYLPSNRAYQVNEFIETYLKHQDEKALLLRYKFGEPWCKIINHSLIKINQITFDETIIHNDTRFSYLVGHYSNKIIVSSKVIYCVTTREGSVSKEISDDRMLTRIKVFGKAELFYHQQNLPLKEYHHYKQLISFILHGRLMLAKLGIKILRKQGITKKQLLKGLASTLSHTLSIRVFRKNYVPVQWRNLVDSKFSINLTVDN